MKTKCLSLIIAGLMLCIVACKKTGLATANHLSDNKSVDVYVAGFINAPYNEAAYWKNGVITKLTDSPTFAIARAIAVHGTDVYVAGTVTSFSPGTDNAVYWKNGVATTLDNISNDSQTWGIAFQGNNMYVVGSVFSNNSLHATYWKNGVAATLPGGVVAYAIAVNGTDVYIAGNAGSVNNSAAAYWKNGVATTLPGGFIANAIAVNGNDVYVGGTTIDGAAVYWKNGVETTLPNNAGGSGTVYWVRGIAANSAGVFVVGGAPSAGNGYVATFWKNNVPSILSAPTKLSSNPANDLATGIYLYGSDVYMTSQVINNATQQYASYYWKNGVPVQLGSGGSNGAFAYGITVVPQ